MTNNKVFFQAIRQRNRAQIGEIIKSEPELVNSTEDNRTALQLAILCGRDDVAELLIVNGADPNLTVDDSWTPLRMALGKEKEKLISTLLAHGADITTPDSRGYTPLHYAAEWCSVRIVRLLLDAGADVNAPTVQGDTPLHLADVHLDTAKLLINYGADVNTRDEDGRTPIFNAVSNGDIEMVQLLLHRGAEINTTDNSGSTPISFTAWPWGGFTTYDVDGTIVRKIEVGEGTPEILKLFSEQVDPKFLGVHDAVSVADIERVRELLEVNPDTVNSFGHGGYTPLHRAAMTDNEEAAKLLLSYGADVNLLSGGTDEGETPLCIACDCGSTKVANLLINSGADVNARNDVDATPLIEAAWGHTDLVNLLMQNGADVNAVDIDGNAALHAAAGSGCAECVKLLIEAGADVNAAGHWQETPLHSAASSDNPEVVKILLAKGADPYAKDGGGRTPLYNASHPVFGLPKHIDPSGPGRAECARLLLEAGEPLIQDIVTIGNLDELKIRLERNPELLHFRDDKSRTLLHLAAEANMREIAEFLLDQGIAIDVKDQEGATPLHYAAETGLPDVVKLLINYSADVNSREARFGFTPLHEAAYHCNIEAVRLLIANGADINAVSTYGSYTPLAQSESEEISEYLWQQGAKPLPEDKVAERH